MIELHYSHENRDAALQYFWAHGSTHYAGKVCVEGAWVAAQDSIAYALVSAADSDEIAKACAPLEQFGEVTYRDVTSVEDI